MHTGNVISVRVHVFPDASKERWIVRDNLTFEAYVREPAQHNLANVRVRGLVARHFSVPLTAVRQSTGHQSRSKLFLVTLEV